MHGTISTCLWFNGQAEEAAEFYVSLFPDSRIEGIVRYTADHPFPPPFALGTALFVRLTIAGHAVALLNGGPEFPQSEAVSLMVPVETQAELDRVWAALIADGGQESQCGWCKDRFGVSWQVCPPELLTMQEQGSSAQLEALWGALTGMRKLDIATLKAAYESAA